MAALDKIQYSKIKKTEDDDVRNVVLSQENASVTIITRLVTEIQARTKGIAD